MTNASASTAVRVAAASDGRPTGAPRIAFWILIGFALAKLVSHLLAVAVTPYEIHRDEFLYLAMGQGLPFWKADFPPAIAVFARVARALFGDSLFSIRLFPALAGTVLLVLTGLLSREFGGRRAAQALAMLAVLLGPLFLRPAALFQPVVFDQLSWTLGYFALVKLAQSSERRWWLLLGLAGGFGLLTKFSIFFFAGGVLLGWLLTQQRRALATRWPYVASAIALLLGSASLVGQFRLGLPVITHMAELSSGQLRRLSALDFLGGQLLMLGPALVLAVLGLTWLLRSGSARQFRVIGWACLGSFLILMLLRGKAYYIGPVYPTLFAAGAAALQSFSSRWHRLAYATIGGLILVLGLAAVPFGLPVLPPPQMARYAAHLGMKGAVTTNRGEVLPLPQDYADMLGWKEQVAAVARVYHQLPAEQRAQAVLLANNYGEAGAIDFYGPRYGLTEGAVMTRTSCLFTPGSKPGQTVVAIGMSPEYLQRFFDRVEVVAEFDHPWMVNEERHRRIIIAESPPRTLRELWPPLAWKNGKAR